MAQNETTVNKCLSCGAVLKLAKRKYCSKDCYLDMHSKGGSNGMTAQTMSKHAVLLCAFTAHHERRGMLSHSTVEYHSAAIDELLTDGLLERSGDTVQISRAGIAWWRRHVSGWQELRKNSINSAMSLNVVNHYCEDGTRKESA